jgi:hypothetical protein
MQGIGRRIGRRKRSCLKKYVQIRNSYPKYLPSESPENPAKHTADQSVINLHSRSKFNGKLESQVLLSVGATTVNVRKDACLSQ